MENKKVNEESNDLKNQSSEELESNAQEEVVSASDNKEEATPVASEESQEAASDDKPEEAAPVASEGSKEAASDDKPEEAAPVASEESYSDTQNMESKETSKYLEGDKVRFAISNDLRKDLPTFKAGDTINVGVKVIEGNQSRVQNFEGVVIALSSGGSMDKSFTVRKISNGVGVERIFPLHSPNIDSIKVLRRGKVRRAKLYYLRKLSGKAANIRQKL